MKIHMDANTGMAGDMFLAACLDLGLNQDELVQALKTIPLPEWSLATTQERRGGIRGLYLTITAPPEHQHRHLPHILALIQDSGLPPPVKERACALFRILADAEGAVHGMDPERVHFHETGAVDAILDLCGAAFAIWRLQMTDVTLA